MDLIEELRWRKMLHDKGMMPGTAEHLRAGAPVTGYIGFDPTAPSLHIGNLATIMLLVHLQRAGHRPVALVGGATGMIGDPSGKSAERNLLDEDALRRNQAGIRAQLERFIEFNDSPTGALVVNNYDWFKDFGFLQFLREVGKHLTVNYMMAKESVQKRIGINKTMERINVGIDDTVSYVDGIINLLDDPTTDIQSVQKNLSELKGALLTLKHISEPDFEKKAEASRSFLQETIFRKAEEAGISYTEFSYQLLQGYDFYHLYKELGCTLQMGASDQWGNITAGTELIQRMTGGEGKAYALTGQLITKADGTKYGKSETGTVWLDPTLTSPYQFYQFFLNAADADAPRLIRVFTLLSQEEIEALEAEHAQAPHRRVLQKALAQDVTTRVHGAAAYEAALAASQVLFGGGDLALLDEATLLDVFAGVPHVEVAQTELAGMDVLTLLSTATGNVIFSSKGEARKMVQNNGVKLNRQKVTPDQSATAVAPLPGNYLVAQKGKSYFLIKLI
ncbi:tyrosine--tRNA ligase [Hymenobacter weizhouensis]|uniref:tyrosine--tRNA ligase n=1 Tax=Hymenobacter sp. YIM 151500-1 TaxID=2987689 RepID=UPI0022260C1E|nr:tyrosine--tRNA ligase [Hymenobacter sp. YIM 151500-1]UYZ64127.1 tyrosine--tRNA ligase [Hymenobacter sp. YIM 151500-1]